MFKTKIVLDEEKIMQKGDFTLDQCKEKLAEICSSENLVEESENMYRLCVPEQEYNVIGTVMMLFGKLRYENLSNCLKEWKTYCDDESEDLYEEDALELYKQKGLIQD